MRNDRDRVKQLDEDFARLQKILQEEQLDLGFEDESPTAAPSADDPFSSMWAEVDRIKSVSQTDVEDGMIDLLMDDRFEDPSQMELDFGISSDLTEGFLKVTEKDLYEGYIRAARKNLLETVFTDVKQYYDDTGKEPNKADFDSFSKWAKKNGFKIPAPGSFAAVVKQIKALAPQSDEGDEEGNNSGDSEFDPSSVEDKTGVLGALGGADEGDLGNIGSEESSADKFQTLKRTVTRFMTNPANSFEKGEIDKIPEEDKTFRHLYLYGTAGIGKTYEVLQAIKTANIDSFWTDKIHFSQTELGKIADIRAVFAKFPQDILIFDDADKMVSGAGGSGYRDSFFKALFDTTNSPSISGPAGKADRKDTLNSMTGITRFNPRESSNPYSDYFRNSLGFGGPFAAMNEAEDFKVPGRDFEDFDDEEDSGNTDLLDTGDEVDDPWAGGRLLFRSRVLFISNNNLESASDAVVSRLKAVSLILSPEEILERISHLQNVLFKKGSKQLVDIEARAVTLYFLKLSNASNGARIPIPGKPGTFLTLEKPAALNFRLFESLCQEWTDVLIDWQNEGLVNSYKQVTGALKAKYVIDFLKRFKRVIGQLNQRQEVRTAKGK